jgi:hypothetical protein
MSLNSDSGVGDHGNKGIAAFKEQHECHRMCDELEFDVKENGGAGEEDELEG